jgi:hypothetical protein
MFYNSQIFDEFKKSIKRANIERFGILVILILSYLTSGTGLAVVIGIGSIIWLLFEIQKLLSYQNLMTEKKIGIHDLGS